MPVLPCKYGVVLRLGDNLDSSELARTEVLASSEDLTTRGPGPATPEIDAPEQVGRYTIEGLLGTGGMGAVFRGRDPELDRPVAVKLIRPTGRRRESYRARLVREAQALAALSHPNVVTVYEVGTHDDGVFVAMELVTGATADAWVSARQRSWREILAMYIEAGRGLAAAHDKGIVHRDFKPSNVLVGDDGRPRVLDFGLATADGTSSSINDSGEDIEGTGPTEVLSTRLTVAGEVMGTPAYMSPEQIRGKKLTVASDQFSFCVALWEALVGARPFPGKTFDSIRVSLTKNRRRPAPSNARVPRRVIALLDRGLHPDPERRWPTMGELIEALERVRSSARTRWRAMGAVAVLGASAAAALMPGAGEERCEPGDVMPWSDARRTALRSQIEAGAPDAWPAVESALDDYAQRWRTAYREVCDGGPEAAGDQETFDLRMACLTHRGAALGAVVEVLADGTDLMARAEQTVGALPSVEECTTAQQGNPKTDVPTDAEDAAKVSALRADLTRADALVNSGRLEEARNVSGAVVDAARPLAFDPLIIEAENQLGVVQSRLGKHAEAETLLAGVFWRASEAGYDEVAAHAAIELAWLVGYLRGKPDKGVEWVRHFESHYRRLGRDPQPNADAVLGPIYFSQDRFDLALPHLDRQLQRELARADGTHDVAVAHMNLAVIHYESGDFEAATTHFDRAQEIYESLFPDGHQDLAMLLIDRSGMAHILGDPEKARTLVERGLAMSRKIHGEVHPTTALGLRRLAEFQSEAGEHDAALATFELANRALAQASLEDRLSAQAEMASAMRRAGRLDDAERIHQKVLADAEESLGPDTAIARSTRHDLGRIAADRGDDETAERLFREALVGADETQPLASAPPRVSLAELLMRRGDHDQAQAILDQQLAELRTALGAENQNTLEAELRVAVVVTKRDPGRGRWLLESLLRRGDAPGSAVRLDPRTRAATQFRLAEVLVAEDAERARTLAADALSAVRDLADEAELVAEIEAWTAEHGEKD